MVYQNNQKGVLGTNNVILQFCISHFSLVFVVTVIFRNFPHFSFKLEFNFFLNDFSMDKKPMNFLNNRLLNFALLL